MNIMLLLVKASLSVMYISFSKFVRLLVALMIILQTDLNVKEKSFCNEVRSQISRAFDKIV